MCNPFPIIWLLLQVSALITPEYKTRNHSKYLGNLKSYVHVTGHASKLYKIWQVFSSGMRISPTRKMMMIQNQRAY